jgi:pyruvate dehydrogenase E1 component alpha subunit
MALADQYQEQDGVTICMFGDGATNIGFFHEGVNLSKVWDLPVLWVCENNQYGMGTTLDRASATDQIRQKAEGYNMPNARIEDGMDIMKVREGVAPALEHVRSGKGPFFLEIVTYRFEGHSMGDPERYRDKDEVATWEKSDPIGIHNRYLIKEKIATKANLDKIEKDMAAEVEEAVEFAHASPEPELDTLYDYIYVEDN